jgi:hypothetical protein
MRMYPHPSGKYLNPQLVTCCYTIQIERTIYQSVFEFGDNKVFFCHTTEDEANKDLLDFVSFCGKC